VFAGKAFQPFTTGREGEDLPAQLLTMLVKLSETLAELRGTLLALVQLLLPNPALLFPMLEFRLRPVESSAEFFLPLPETLPFLVALLNVPEHELPPCLQAFELQAAMEHPLALHLDMLSLGLEGTLTAL